jgi:hypothetical protein
MSNATLTATARVTTALVIAMYHANQLVKRTNGLARKSLGDVASAMRIPVAIQKMYASDLLGTYVAMADLRRPLSDREAAVVLASEDVKWQGVLPCGEPAQTDLEIRTAIRITGDDFDGSQLVAEVRRAVNAAQAACQYEKRENDREVTLFVRYQPNNVCRDLRKDGNYATRARFGGRLYTGDTQSHGGYLIATITPNAGERTALGHVEWHQPGFAK